MVESSWGYIIRGCGLCTYGYWSEVCLTWSSYARWCLVYGFLLGRKFLARVASGEFQIVHVPLEEQHADFLTKPLETETFRFHRNFLMDLWWFHALICCCHIGIFEAFGSVGYIYTSRGFSVCMECFREVFEELTCDFRRCSSLLSFYTCMESV